MQRHDEKHLITQRLQMPLPELARLLQQVGALRRGDSLSLSSVLQAEVSCSVLGFVFQMPRCMLHLASM